MYGYNYKKSSLNFSLFLAIFEGSGFNFDLSVNLGSVSPDQLQEDLVLCCQSRIYTFHVIYDTLHIRSQQYRLFDLRQNFSPLKLLFLASPYVTH